MSRPPRKPSLPTSRHRAPRVPRATTVAEAKLFMNGRSQAVRLPAEYRFVGDSVYVKRWRGAVILLPKRQPWAPLVASLGTFSKDFMSDRGQPAPQERLELDALFD
jgi:antitoxin VapB